MDFTLYHPHEQQYEMGLKSLKDISCEENAVPLSLCYCHIAMSEKEQSPSRKGKALPREEFGIISRKNTSHTLIFFLFSSDQ
ncbi:hypothetical protein [Bartonella sp. AU55XJBT]|uniref:hypothetical protein n=1 Tax=Bartonella sp. AU55XJBT TaxID=3019091 RepID=UPI002362FC73|nr:hypothetical protein [Bartonella sp. AU55XJBT]